MDCTAIVTDRQLIPLATLADRINQEHRAATAALNSGLEHARRAGEMLIDTKRQCPHGGWMTWLKVNFEGAPRTARAYMIVAKRWNRLVENGNGVANLPSLRKALAITTEPKPKTGKSLDDYLANVDEDLLAEIPELSSDTMLVALIEDGLLELWPVPEHVGYYYLLLYENLSTDAADVVYDRRGCLYTRRLLAHTLEKVHKVRPWAWTTEPARNEIPLPVQKDRDPTCPPAARAYPSRFAALEDNR